MRRIWQCISSARFLGVAAFLLLAAWLLIDLAQLQAAALWAALLAVALALGWGLFLLLRWLWRRYAAARLAARALPGSDLSSLRRTLVDAIATIKSSKLGQSGAKDALYQLPWCMLIGSPGAGKSALVRQSGLHFPIPATVREGSGQCDWHFTPNGILLDTDGRYLVSESARTEWLGLLGLLRKYRARVPLNAILIAVSVADLLGDDPQAPVELAKALRARVQELTEKLAVCPPVYLVVTKLDLVAGFGDFFRDADKAERQRIWGATIHYNRRRTQQDVMALFAHHFDLLHAGLQERSLQRLAARRTPGLITFPLEFTQLREPLSALLATLLEENTYQYRPMFRGLYFCSALQQGQAHEGRARQVAARFDLQLNARAAQQDTSQASYFLHDVLRQVIFADKDLVARYASPTQRRLRLGAFLAATLLLGCALGCWTWSYLSNVQLIASVQEDLDKVVRLQQRRVDLQSRLDALDILQDRITQLAQWRQQQPWMLSFGLYQGDTLERKLRQEYFAGVRQIMVLPVAAGLEAMLARLATGQAAAPAAAGPYQDASPASVTDGYNALKAYLMLGDKARAEPSHLNDQMTRYWRGWLDSQRGAMPREQMIRSAERLMRFHVSQIGDPAWPQISLKLALLDSAREQLRRVASGTPARQRAYADIVARAATRFPGVTVARLVGEPDQGLITGSHAVSGAYTRAAWEQFVSAAIDQAASKELRSSDWVLNTVSRDDLTLQGSPEQIRQALTELYKADYVREWRSFLQGISVAELSGFDASVAAMNRLGDPRNSPLATLLQAVQHDTEWDNPAAARPASATPAAGLKAWLQARLLRAAPAEARQLIPPTAPAGVLAAEFAGLARLLATHDKGASLMGGYLDCLSRLRTRLNQLKNQGDPGPGARQLMQQTLEGSGSELGEALRYVDEQMLTGMSDNQKQALRPLLVRPLVQTFAMLVLPSESDINKTWQAQVVEPFQATLAGKYPFTPGARVEASPAEIAQLFGPEGAVARFVNTAMGPLVVRRGDVLSARTWAELGIALAPHTVAGFPGWVAPLSANGVAAGGAPQTIFQLLALPAPGAQEYTVEIDGQLLRYRNTPPVWTNMVHPGQQGTPGARIAATTLDGKTVELFNEAGRFGLKKMIDAAQRQRKEGGVFALRWSAGALSVALDLKIISSPDTNGDASARGRGFHGLQLPAQIVGRGAVVPNLVQRSAP